MNRRGFLSLAAKAPLAIVAASPMVAVASQKIWVPDQEKTDEVQIAKSFITNGNVVYGFLVSPNLVYGLDMEMLAKDALFHFPSGAPVLIMRNDGLIKFHRVFHDLVRFRYTGSKEQAIAHTKAPLIGAFEDATAFGWIASR